MRKSSIEKSSSFTVDFKTAQSFAILSNDHIMIPYLDNSRPHSMAKIEGQIKFPGRYPIEEGITTVLVEAGGYLASGLVKSNLVDKLVIYRAPMIIGGDGIAAWHPLGVEQLGMSKRFKIQNIERIGPDIIETYNRCTEALYCVLE